MCFKNFLQSFSINLSSRRPFNIRHWNPYAWHHDPWENPRQLSTYTCTLIGVDSFWETSSPMNATSVFDSSPSPESRAATTAVTLESISAILLSISATSIRTTLILTWVSARPRYRNELSKSQTKSPVRYSRGHTSRAQAGLSKNASRANSDRSR